MPVPIQSRYRAVPVYDATDPRGGVHPTVGVRLGAPPEAQPGELGLRRRHLLVGAEDLPALAARYLGDPAAWWRIADQNPRIFPLDLATGSILLLPGSREAGRIERTRSF